MEKTLIQIKIHTFSVLRILYIIFCSLFNTEQKQKFFEIGRIAAKRSLKIEIPVIELGEIARIGEPIELLEPRFSDGNVSLFELVCLCSLTKKYAPQNIFEIGTFDGRTTLNLAANAPKAQVFTLDLPRQLLQTGAVKMSEGDRNIKFINKEQSGERYRGTLQEKQITQLLGDSAKFDFSQFVQKMDLVFVDASHNYENVMLDSENALNIGKKGSLILWHDYGVWEGTTKALNYLRKNDSRFKNLRLIKDTSLAYLIV